MKKETLNVDWTGTEALRKFHAGVRLICPRCRAEIQSTPPGVAPGQRIHGLVCPNNPQHYILIIDDETAMKNVRAGMKEIAARTAAEKAKAESEKAKAKSEKSEKNE